MLLMVPLASNAVMVVPAISLTWNFPSHSRQVRDPILVSWVKRMVSYMVRDASKNCHTAVGPTIDWLAIDVSRTTSAANAAANAASVGRLTISSQARPGVSSPLTLSEFVIARNSFETRNKMDERLHAALAAARWSGG